MPGVEEPLVALVGETLTGAGTPLEVGTVLSATVGFAFLVVAAPNTLPVPALLTEVVFGVVGTIETVGVIVGEGRVATVGAGAVGLVLT
jgi:hypothetical protein